MQLLVCRVFSLKDWPEVIMLDCTCKLRVTDADPLTY